MQEANKKLLTEVQEASGTENQKLFEASKTKNQTVPSESRRDSEQRMERMQAAILSKIGKEFEETSGNYNRQNLSKCQQRTKNNLAKMWKNG